jgi:DNA anti-recombination protein RmuC
MTGEEMERAIDFLLKSQANLESRIEQVNANLGLRIDETNRQLADTNRLLGEYAQMQTQLIQTVTRTFEAQAEINRRTDERINALIGAVERVAGERRDGKSE